MSDCLFEPYGCQGNTHSSSPAAVPIDSGRQYLEIAK